MKVKCDSIVTTVKEGDKIQEKAILKGEDDNGEYVLTIKGANIIRRFIPGDSYELEVTPIQTKLFEEDEEEA